MELKATLVFLLLSTVISLACGGKYTTKCIKHCRNRPDDDYHSCNGCHLYASCSGGEITDNRKCPGKTEFDANHRSCRAKSSTCEAALKKKSEPQGDGLGGLAAGEMLDTAPNLAPQASGPEFYPGCGCDVYKCSCSEVPATCETTLTNTDVETTYSSTVSPTRTTSTSADFTLTLTTTSISPVTSDITPTMTTCLTEVESTTVTTTRVLTPARTIQSDVEATSTSTLYSYDIITSSEDSVVSYTSFTTPIDNVPMPAFTTATATVPTASTNFITSVTTETAPTVFISYDTTSTRYNVITDTDFAFVTSTITHTLPRFVFNRRTATTITRPRVDDVTTEVDVTIRVVTLPPSDVLVRTTSTDTVYLTSTHTAPQSNVIATSTSTRLNLQISTENLAYTNTLKTTQTDVSDCTDSTIIDEFTDVFTTDTSIRDQFTTSQATSTNVVTTYTTTTYIEDKGTCDFFATCSNHMKVYIDGVCQPGFWGVNDWKYTSMIKIPYGTQVIGIECHNIDSLGGILASSTNCNIGTNATWWCTDGFEDDWNMPGFRPTTFTWDTATVIGANGIDPWGSRPGISPTAHWIWNPLFSGPKCTEKAYCIALLDDNNNQVPITPITIEK